MRGQTASREGTATEGKTERVPAEAGTDGADDIGNRRIDQEESLERGGRVDGGWFMVDRQEDMLAGRGMRSAKCKVRNAK